MQTLFLKYRPQNFGQIVGQTATIRTLKNALSTGKTAHAYLFNGSRGTGKTSTARIVAKALLCGVDKNGEPNQESPLWDMVNDGSLTDLIEIDAASNNSVEDIRDLREKIRFAPSIAEKKVYIIDEVHMLSKSAFNALLKTLEEPPSYAYFILATTEIHKVPETIASRCQVFSFGRFTNAEILGQLQYICDNEGFSYEDAALQQMAEKAEGGMRDAIGMLERVAAESGGQITLDAAMRGLGLADEQSMHGLWGAITSGDAASGLQIITDIHDAGADMRHFGHDMLQFLRKNLRKNIEDAGAVEAINKGLRAFQKATSELRSTPIKTLPYEIAVVELITIDVSAGVIAGSVETPKVVKKKTETVVDKESMVNEAPKVEEITGGDDAMKEAVDEMNNAKINEDVSTNNTQKIEQITESVATKETAKTEPIVTEEVVDKSVEVVEQRVNAGFVFEDGNNEALAVEAKVKVAQVQEDEQEMRDVPVVQRDVVAMEDVTTAEILKVASLGKFAKVALQKSTISINRNVLNIVAEESMTPHLEMMEVQQEIVNAVQKLTGQKITVKIGSKGDEKSVDALDFFL